MPRRRLPGARDRRKRQNAEAQRAYRARQKEKVRNLEQMVVAAWSSQGPSNSAGGEIAAPLPHSGSESPKRENAMDSNAPASFTASEIFQSLRPPSIQDVTTCYKIVVRENFTMRDIVKYGLISMGYAMDTPLFDSAVSRSSRSWIELVKSNYGDVDMKRVVTAGVTVLAQLTAPQDWPMLETCPRLCTNTITLSVMSFASAVIANTAMLNLLPEELIDDDSQSRFYRNLDWELDEPDKDARDGSDYEGHIALDLAPTIVQKQVPHHPCHDLIPWPSFRSYAIILSSMDPPMIDEDDLCLDMLSGGLQCWGSTHGRGQGVPWDSRSWEAAPWFLEKWKILIREDKDDILRTSAWWRGLQKG